MATGVEAAILYFAPEFIGLTVAEAAVINAAAAYVASTAISYAVQSALTDRGADKDARSALGSTVVSVREPASPRQVIYGRTRVGGTFAYLSTRDGNRSLHAVVVLSTHEVDAIEEVWFDDYIVTPSMLDSDGYVTSGRFTTNASNVGIAQEATVSGAGVVSVSSPLYSIWSVEVRDPNTGDTISLFPSSTATSSTYVFTSSYVVTVDTAYAGWKATVVSNSILNTSLMRVRRYTGNQASADTFLVAECSDEWTTNHKLLGCAYVYVKLIFDRYVWANGMPNITALVRGKKVFDPRTGTYAYSNNPALAIADYMCNSIYGLKMPYSTRIDSADLITAANACEASVATKTGTETRYTCDGAFRTNETPKSILAALKASMAGELVRVGGKWKILAGTYVAPTITFDERGILGPYTVQTIQSRRDSFSGVKGTFVSSATRYQPDSYPSIVSSTYDSEDGERVFAALDLRFTQSPSMAQRIAKSELRKARQQISVTLPYALDALRAVPGENIGLTIPDMGWSAKPFFYQSMSLKQDDQGFLSVEMTLRETASNVYDWTPASEEGDYDAAPNTTLEPISLYQEQFSNGSNLAPNSTFRFYVSPWERYATYQGSAGMYNDAARVVADVGFDNYLAITQPNSRISVNSLACAVSNGPLTGKGLGVQAGRRYQFSANVYGDGTKAAVFIDWYTASRSYIASTDVAYSGPHTHGTRPAQDHPLVSVFGTAPNSAAIAQLCLGKTGTAPGSSQSIAYFSRLMFARALEDQLTPDPWVPSIAYGNAAETYALGADAATEVYTAFLTSNLATVVGAAFDPFGSGWPSAPGAYDIASVSITLLESTRLALHFSGTAYNNSGVNVSVGYGFNQSDFDFPFVNIPTAQYVSLSHTKYVTLAAGSWTIYARADIYQVGGGGATDYVYFMEGTGLRVEVLKR